LLDSYRRLDCDLHHTAGNAARGKDRADGERMGAAMKRISSADLMWMAMYSAIAAVFLLTTAFVPA
jgi:hypothetical protein